MQFKKIKIYVLIKKYRCLLGFDHLQPRIIWWVMVLPSATAHLNSLVITLAVGACGEESTLMKLVPTALTGIPCLFPPSLLSSSLLQLLFHTSPPALAPF